MNETTRTKTQVHFDAVLGKAKAAAPQKLVGEEAPPERTKKRARKKGLPS